MVGCCILSRDQPVRPLLSPDLFVVVAARARTASPLRSTAPSPQPTAHPPTHRRLGTQHPGAHNLRTRSFGCGHAASRPERHGGSVSRSSAPQRRAPRRRLAASHSAGRGVRQPGGVPPFLRPLAAELRWYSPEVGSSPSPSSSPPSWCRARGSSSTCCPSACWPRCSTCRRLARPTPRRAESAEAKGRTAQVGPPLHTVQPHCSPRLHPGEENRRDAAAVLIFPSCLVLPRLAGVPAVGLRSILWL